MGTFFTLHSKTSVLKEKAAPYLTAPLKSGNVCQRRGKRRMILCLGYSCKTDGGERRQCSCGREMPIWLDFPDHKSADLEGHPHSLTTIHKPLASTSIGSLPISTTARAVVWQLGKECIMAEFLPPWCFVPLSQLWVHQMPKQKWTKGMVRLSNPVQDAISWDRWCGYYTGSCNRVYHQEGGVPPGKRCWS